MIAIENLVKRHGAREVLHGVSLEARPGRVTGFVGPNGAGTSSTLRCLLGLDRADGGRALIGGRPYRELREPLRTVGAVLDGSGAHPSRTARGHLGWVASGAGISRRRVAEVLDVVGLSEAAGRRVRTFSLGMGQRLGLATALLGDPEVLVLDEPVSALDVSIQAGVINLLDELRATMGLSYLFVAHDLSVVRHIADRVAVMYLGRIVEIGDVDTIFEAPAHPYTQALLSAIPIPDPAKERGRSRIVLEGDMPSPANPPSGCRFRTRCPKFASGLTDDERSACLGAMPEFRSQGEDHDVACYYPERTAVF